MNQNSLSLWEDNYFNSAKKDQAQRQTLSNENDQPLPKPKSIFIYNRPSFKFVKIRQVTKKQLSKKKLVKQMIRQGLLQPKQKPVKIKKLQDQDCHDKSIKVTKFSTQIQENPLKQTNQNLIRVQKLIGGEMLFEYWQGAGKYFNREMQRNLKERFIQLKGRPMSNQQLQKCMLALLKSIESGSRNIKLQNYLI